MLGEEAGKEGWYRLKVTYQQAACFQKVCKALLQASRSFWSTPTYVISSSQFLSISFSVTMAYMENWQKLPHNCSSITNRKRRKQQVRKKEAKGKETTDEGMATCPNFPNPVTPPITTEQISTSSCSTSSSTEVVPSSLSPALALPLHPQRSCLSSLSPALALPLHPQRSCLVPSPQLLFYLFIHRGLA